MGQMRLWRPRARSEFHRSVSASSQTPGCGNCQLNASASFQLPARAQLAAFPGFVNCLAAQMVLQSKRVLAGGFRVKRCSFMSGYTHTACSAPTFAESALLRMNCRRGSTKSPIRQTTTKPCREGARSSRDLPFETTFLSNNNFIV